MSLVGIDQSKSERRAERGPLQKPAPSLICSGLSIRGNLNSGGEVQIDGAVAGDVFGGSIVIGHGGSVRGEVVGEKVAIYGAVFGTVVARAVWIGSTAYVTGTIAYGNLTTQSGARIVARCKHIQMTSSASGWPGNSQGADGAIDAESLAAE